MIAALPALVLAMAGEFHNAAVVAGHHQQAGDRFSRWWGDRGRLIHGHLQQVLGDARAAAAAVFCAADPGIRGCGRQSFHPGGSQQGRDRVRNF